ncbi:NAD(P)-binding protein [Penicillium lagena]|uniref:NAD(P)-binding protein n=1 Tax=Penicillium lagena TaxID=94218 RepID=UPI0025412923|nr:NAD(P)-binding protein [Penicillium lagena]KAJ5601390.1 NAD(P)-binding protein [Penicillium lagena]
MTTILVTGATGKQGGAVIRNLLDRKGSFQILAVTRDIQSPSARKLSQSSSDIKLIEGNLNDPKEIFENAKEQACTPIWGVFSVQAVDPRGDKEKFQGIALIDESIRQGVQFFVYSSVDRGGDASIRNPTRVPHFGHKHEIEKHLIEKSKHSGMNWTILRPVAFFENLTPDFLGKVFATAWQMSLKGKPLQLVATSDIGFFAAEVFMHPQESKQRTFSLAGDELTFEQMAQVFEQKTGKKVPTTFKLPTWLIMAAVKDLGLMFKWFHDEGYKANISELRKINPELKGFGSWLENESQFTMR